MESMSQLSLPGETGETGDVAVVPLEELLAPASKKALTWAVPPPFMQLTWPQVKEALERWWPC